MINSERQKSKVAIFFTFSLLFSWLFAANPTSTQANPYKSVASWVREDIGWGWASTQYRQIFNAGDLDNNGYQDMMLTDRSGNLWFYPARNNTSFSSRKKAGFGWNNMRQIFGGIDFNGDRNIDILGIDHSGTLFLYPGLGNGYFGSKRSLGTGWSNVTNISASQQGFNGQPIIIGSTNGTLKAWQTDGIGHFTNTITYGGGWDAMKLTAITGDVSGDGIPDMWVISKTGELRLYVTKSVSGLGFTAYVTGTGWSDIKYFLPRVDNSKVIRTIFPDGVLRQYTLNHFSPTTTRWIPPQPAPKPKPAPAPTPAPHYQKSTSGNCSPQFPIKGNKNSGIYHVPGQRYYNSTRAEECFATEAAAKNAGYRKARV